MYGEVYGVKTYVRNPLADYQTDEEILLLADILANDLRERRVDVDVARSAQMLFTSSLLLLRDWFKDEYYTPCGVTTVVSMALMQGKYESSCSFQEKRSPLDLLFLQIERGVKYTRGEDGLYAWRRSDFRRKHDGACPGDTGGLPFGTDAASAFYARWRSSASPRRLEKSVYECLGWVCMIDKRVEGMSRGRIA